MYTIYELSTITGISHRRLRYWKVEQLLPPPIKPNGSKRDAFYTDAHIRRVEEIKRVLIDGKVTVSDLAERFFYEQHPELIDPEDCEFCQPHTCDCESL